MGGLTVRAMWSVGERTAAPTRGGDIMGVSAVYAGGPLTLQGYYQQLKGIDGTGTTNNNQFGVGAGYNFGAFRLTASYAVADPAGTNNKHSGFSVGAGVKVGVGESAGSGHPAESRHGRHRSKSTTIGVAYVHPLSRHQRLRHLRPDAQQRPATSRFAADETIAPNAVGNDRRPSVGVRHTFLIARWPLPAGRDEPKRRSNPALFRPASSPSNAKPRGASAGLVAPRICDNTRAATVWTLAVVWPHFAVGVERQPQRFQ
jgi:predicted porin